MHWFYIILLQVKLKILVSIWVYKFAVYSECENLSRKAKRQKELLTNCLKCGTFKPELFSTCFVKKYLKKSNFTEKMYIKGWI